MRLHQLAPARGSKHARKRVGRGDGSGQGTTAGKGTKGQKARAGGGVRPGFEGGQLPLIKRLPHTRGFHNPFRREYAPVNVGQLNRLEGIDTVTSETLHAAGLIPSANVPVKILGDGELSQALTVRVAKFSVSARAKIEAAGGRIEGSLATAAQDADGPSTQSLKENPPEEPAAAPAPPARSRAQRRRSSATAEPEGAV